jgi:ABC-type antimicrobial peptide transport system permease subunit
MKDQNRIWRLMARKLSGEASEEELQELEKLIKENPDLVFQFQIVADFWKSKQQEQKASESDPLFKRIKAGIQKQKTLSMDRPILKKKSLLTKIGEAIRAFLSLIAASFLRNGALLASYIKFSRRTLLKNKAFSFINVSGLAVGMASAVLISLWIQNELTCDQFHTKKDRIYQVLNRGKFEEKVYVWDAMPHPLAPALKNEFPKQVEETLRVSWVAAFVLKKADKVIQTEGLLADPSFFHLFDFPFRQGDPGTALNKPYSIVVTESLAKRMFGKTDALGQTIRIDSTQDFTITGVVKNLPTNTSFSFEYIVPFSYMKDVHWSDTNWNHNNIRTFVLLRPGISEKTANALFANVKKQHISGIADELFVHPMSKWWLHSGFENGEIAGGRIEDVRLFSIIVAFILLIACINYMNLSTARSEKSAREVGIRKVMGAQKISLIFRFLGESTIVAFIAGVISLVIVQIALPSFNHLVRIPGFNIYSGKHLFIPYGSLNFWIAAIGFILFTGILAGIYPSFYLSAYKPISVLQKRFKKIRSFFAFRKVLVVFQFGFAIMLIICTIIIYRQIAYGKDRNPGYNVKDRGFVYVKGDMLRNYELIRKELFEKNLVTDMTRTSSPILDVWAENDDYRWTGVDTTKRMAFAIFEGENRFVEFHELSLIAGRDFNLAAYPSDSTAMILTESAVKRMKFKDPVGEIIKNAKGYWHVIGVIKDFIPEKPYSPPYPIIIHSGHAGFGAINFKLNPSLSKNAAKDKISEVFSKHSPGYAVEYRRLEDEYANKFSDEVRTGKLATLFASLTIFICCLGLFALAAYTAEARIKEIGIRKVLGASVAAITALLSREFLKLVTIAFLIASPLAWWAMSHWLKNYPYHVDISWWIFALTGLLSLLITFLSIGYQAIKAALSNPVKSLKTE